MNIQEVADFFGVSVQTIRRRVNDGQLVPLPKPALAKRNPRLLFRREDVEKLNQTACDAQN